MKNKLKITAVVAVFAAFFIGLQTSALAASPGSTAFPLSVKDWLENGPVTLPRPPSKEKKDAEPAPLPAQGFYLVAFWTADSVLCANFAPTLALLQERFQGRGLKCAVLFNEREAPVKQFLSSFCNDLNYAVGLDDGGKTSSAYLEPGVVLPVFFVIGPDAKIIWRGTALDIETVVTKICEGRFDLKREEKLSSMRKEMQTAIQAGVMENVLVIASHCKVIIRIQLKHSRSYY